EADQACHDWNKCAEEPGDPDSQYPLRDCPASKWGRWCALTNAWIGTSRRSNLSHGFERLSRLSRSIGGLSGRERDGVREEVVIKRRQGLRIHPPRKYVQPRKREGEQRQDEKPSNGQHENQMPG